MTDSDPSGASSPPTPTTWERLAPDAKGPAEGEVPHAPPARPAGPDRVVPRRTPRRRTLPGTYSLGAVPPVTASQRLRSALGVLLVVVAVGLALAAAAGVLVVAISRALQGAVS